MNRCMLATIALLSACARPTSPLAAGRTSVLLLVVDTLRADRLGAYGYSRPTSPNLDALAGRGVRFGQYYTSCAWTRPAMASLLTGLYPRTTGVYEQLDDRLAPDLLSLAERLHGAGYRTLGVTANPNINTDYGFDQGFDRYVDSGGMRPLTRAGGGARRKGMETAELVTDRTLALVDEAALAGAPYYLQIQYIDPHIPYDPPPTHLDAVRPASVGSADPYDGEIHFADAEIGRLLDGLTQRGLMRDTLVIFTSDHGEGLGSHAGIPNATQHGTHLYDSVLHVPLVFAHPALPQGATVHSLSSAVDILPTMQELLGLERDGDLPGRSLAPALLGGRDRDVPAYVFAETDWLANHKVMVHSADRALVRNDDSRDYQVEGRFEGRALKAVDRRALTEVPITELFAMPGEQVPATRLQEPDTEARLLAALSAWEAQTVARPPLNRSPSDVETLRDGSVRFTVSGGAGHQPPSVETTEHLRELGYLDGPR